MDISTIRAFLGWCAVINMGLLLLWFLTVTLGHDWVYRLHSRWYKVPREQFNAIHYGGLAYFKIVILVFNVVPYLALLIIE